MADPEQPTTILYADREHSAIRAVFPILLLVGFCGGYFLLLALLDVLFPRFDARVFVACLGSIPLGLLFAGVGEAVLKRRWPSGRRVVIADGGLTIYRQPDAPEEFVAVRSVNLVRWYFSLSGYPRGGRERRISDSWYCMAVQLRQDDVEAVVYTFVSPRTKDEWLARYSGFHEIDPRDVYDRSLSSRLSLPTRPELPAEVIGGPEGRYWLAERERWQEGMELAPEDFARLLDEVRSYNTHT